MIVILEMSRPWLWFPFVWHGPFRGVRAWRIGWGFWAIAIYRENFHDFLKHVRSGSTGWAPSEAAE